MIEEYIKQIVKYLNSIKLSFVFKEEIVQKLLDCLIRLVYSLFFHVWITV